jgi:hypothetical protein
MAVQPNLALQLPGKGRCVNDVVASMRNAPLRALLTDHVEGFAYCACAIARRKRSSACSPIQMDVQLLSRRVGKWPMTMARVLKIDASRVSPTRGGMTQLVNVTCSGRSSASGSAPRSPVNIPMAHASRGPFDSLDGLAPRNTGSEPARTAPGAGRPSCRDRTQWRRDAADPGLGLRLREFSVLRPSPFDRP